ncbi:MAG: ATP-binding protein [Phycisphaeraceae bacterium]|nr:MAG: ATP-binding protein [Phycisphaeraceae bacterium]
MDERPHIHIELVSDPIYLSGARELVGSVARRLGFDDLQCSKIALAVDEALCNIIRHGYDRAADRPIWISVWPAGRDESGRPSGIRLVIEDEARQVEPNALKGRELDDVRPGGLGVHIIREVMDDVVYAKRKDKGMRLSMVKHAPRRDGPGRTCSVTLGRDGEGSA